MIWIAGLLALAVWTWVALELGHRAGHRHEKRAHDQWLSEWIDLVAERDERALDVMLLAAMELAANDHVRETVERIGRLS